LLVAVVLVQMVAVVAAVSLLLNVIHCQVVQSL
jgi:hypothetical protein